MADDEMMALDNEALAYVQNHSLEEHLSAAVDIAIQQRAEQPLQAIIAHLQDIIASGGAVPKTPKRTHQHLGAGRMGAGSGRGGPLSLELHVKARSQDNPDYPPRLPVPEETVRWHNSWPAYDPPEWTHNAVHANARDLPTGHKWADPADAAALRAELNERTTYSTEQGAAHTFADALDFDAAGRPMNPVGRTGLAGRGLLGKWGANHAADPIVTRIDPTSGKLQVVAIQRKDTLQWAIPGGMVDAGEAVSVTVKREFTEEAGAIEDPEERERFESDVKTLFATGKQVYRGYVDDPRSTDNAWMETTAFHFHCSPELGTRLPLAAGDDAGKVMWLDVSMGEEKYRSLYGAHRALIDEAVWSAWSRGELQCELVAKTPAVQAEAS